MIEFVTANMAPIMFMGLIVFLLMGFWYGSVKYVGNEKKEEARVASRIPFSEKLQFQRDNNQFLFRNGRNNCRAYQQSIPILLRRLRSLHCLEQFLMRLRM